MSDDAERQKTASPSFVPVCAIGASAGGVTALQGLFRQLPDDLGLAYVVILHLSPDQPSALSEILAGCTRMPVLQIDDGPTLKRNCVFVIPPDRELVIEGDSVTARPFTEPRGRRAPIDMFFRSIAAARGDGIAVVLSGAGSDGTLGLRAVKEAGGVIMVQEPAEAGFGSMPQNAIATGDADFVAPLARLAERLAEVARSKEAVRSLDMDGSANDLRRIVAFLRARTGHDFSSYKRATVMRRVVRRMQVCRTDTLAAYADHLLTTPEETKELFSDLLISVTMFFRDPGAFVALERLVVGPLFDEMDPGAESGIRAWVVGCATGEEAYSLAMLLLEEAARRKLHPTFQIFATDLDEGALATAREGRYPRTIEADVSEERLARFFMNEGTHYRVRKELRDSVLFAKHSAIKEPPFIRLDLVTCRNLLIYLERSSQQQLCALFHYGLKPGRFLFLGSAETADSAPDLFVPLDREARIYGARPQASQTLPILPQFAAPERLMNPGQAILGRLERPDLPGALHVAALERSAPPNALVDDGHAILHLSASAGQFIQPSAGPLSNLLPAVVHPELRLDLRLALTRALDGKQPTITLPVTIAMAGGPRRIAMQVIPVPNAAHMGAQALVLFLDGGAASEGGEPEAAPDTRPDEVRRLHAELKAAQEALVASRIGHETAIQDLRATNEELQSINEEYRSTAEELETSKEELQSINEELHTVNAELKSKLGSISVAHSDLQNLTTATEIGTLFLDADLRIKMFTAPIADLFNVTAADIGHTITDFTHRLEYDGLEADARRVLWDLAPVETEVRSKVGQWYAVRLRPYRTVEDRVDGTVVTFVDITARHEAEAVLRGSEERFRAFVTASSDAVYRMSPDWSEMRQLQGGAFLRDTAEPSEIWLDHYIQAEDQLTVRAAIDRATTAKSIFELEYRVIRADGSPGWTLSRAVPILAEDGRIKEWLGAATDITARVQAQEALRESEALRRVALAGGRMGTWRWNLNDRLVWGDTQFLALWGFSPSDDPLPLSLFTGRQSPEGVAQTEAVVRNAIEAAEEFDAPVEVVSGPAAGRWLRWRGRAATDNPSVLYGVSFDITEQVRAEASVRDGERQQAYLFNLSDALRHPADPHVIAAQATRLLGEHLQADRTFLTEVEADGVSLHVRDEYLRSGAQSVLGDYSFDQFGAFVSRALHGARVLAVEDVSALDGLNAAERANYAAVGIAAYLLIPLVRDGRLSAYLTVNHRTARAWTEGDKATAQQTADRTWTAMERARAEAALRMSEERQAFLLTLSDALRPLGDAIGICNAAMRVLGTHLGVTRAQYYDIDESGEYAESSGVFCAGPPPYGGRIRFDDFGTYLREAYLANRTVVVEDCLDNPQLNEAGRALHLARQVRGIIGVPLVKGGKLVATLGISHAAPRRWTAVEVALVEETAERTWAAVERAHAEVALRDSEERHRLAMGAVEAMVFDWDVPSGRVVRSDGLRRLLGYGPDEAAETTGWWGGRIHPEDRASMGWPAREAMEAGAPRFEAQVRMQHRDGRWVDVLDTGTILYGADGRPHRIIGSSVDVTTRKRAEDALRESEERFRQFGEASQDVLWIRDAGTFQWEYLTPAFEAIYGLSREAALRGDNMVGWLELIVPEDRERAAASLRRVRDGELVTFEYRIRRPADGEVRWLRNTDFPIRDAVGTVVRIGGIGHDVTELKHAEEALAAAELRQRALVEGIPQLVWRAVDGGEWTWASPQWTGFTGQSEAESHGWGWLDTLHPDDRDVARQAWSTAAETGGFEAEYRIRQAGSGSYRWFQTRATPVRNGGDTIIEWLGTSNDINDLRGYQERLAVLVAELQHRTRNLLGVVRSTADMTLRSSTSLDGFAARFHDRLGALARVQGLLSRLNEGDRVTFDELIGAELSALGQAGGSDRVTLVGPDGVALRSSTVQTFAMALHELATNAVKYGALHQPGGRLTVTWRLERSDADGQPWLHVDWHESGVVMPLPGALPLGGGTGRSLIERALPYQLGARTTYVMASDGVRCSISLPVSSRTAGGGADDGGTPLG